MLQRAIVQALVAGVIACSGVAAGNAHAANPFKPLKRYVKPTSSPLTVDLGYGIYEGVANETTGINSWLGIRFAAPPTGSLRWQAPQVPAVNRNGTIAANAYGSSCPQSPPAFGIPQPTVYYSEDCLFLNVFAPANASNLPVFFYIHGGGYGAGNGQLDFTSFIKQNNDGFIAVSIQYRLGAFGFLAGDEVHRNGVLNAGLLDQEFGMKWAQAYVKQFGGDPSRVTIAGESAGGGSVMLQTMAYGGTRGDELFVGGFAASPYLPWQYGYKAGYSEWAYSAFAEMAGCAAPSSYGHTSSNAVFKCLVGKDSTTLQNASSTLSSQGIYGTWVFLPVTDGTFVQELPSKQLPEKKVNGKRLLTSNNAQEGFYFVPQNITTEDIFIDWLKLSFPLLSDSDVADVLAHYPSSSGPVDPTAERYATSGYGEPSALNMSESATGQQQRAFNLYAEVTFICPSYWLSEAFADNKKSYRYQYSVIPAYHASDLSGYFGPPAVNQGPDLFAAFSRILGNFVTVGNPSISAALANGASSSHPDASNPTTNWPLFTPDMPYQIDINQTGGTETVLPTLGVNITEYINPGLMNNFTLANAYTWEAGRGARCDFWRSIGPKVPE